MLDMLDLVFVEIVTKESKWCLFLLEVTLILFSCSAYSISILLGNGRHQASCLIILQGMAAMLVIRFHGFELSVVVVGHVYYL